MLKQLLAAVGVMAAAVNFAFAAAVEVNSADRAALDAVKEIGPKTAEAVIAERSKGGPFKDWDDLVKRVKGIGPANAAKMSGAGLTVNGQSRPNAPAKAMSMPKTKPADAAVAAKPAESSALPGGKNAATSEVPAKTVEAPATKDKTAVAPPSNKRAPASQAPARN